MFGDKDRYKEHYLYKHDQITRMDRLIIVREGLRHAFFDIYKDHMDKLTHIPDEGDTIHDGMYHYYHFRAFITGKEVEELAEMNNYLGNMSFDHIPCVIINNLTLHQVTQETAKALLQYEEVKFSVSRPFEEYADRTKFNLNICSLDMNETLTPEDKVYYELKGGLWHVERRSYFKYFTYFPAVENFL